MRQDCQRGVCSMRILKVRLGMWNARRRSSRDSELSLSDNLLVGPSRPSARSHATVRAKFWQAGELETRYRRILAEINRAECITVLCGRDWSSRLLLGFVIAHVPPRVSVRVELYEGKHPMNIAAVQVMDDASRLIRVVNLKSSARQRMTISWRLFTSAKSESVLAGAQGLLGLKGVAFFRGLLPRTRDQVTLLSRLDSEILRAARRQITPGEVFDAAGGFLRNWGIIAGDLTLARRFSAWTSLPRGAPALSRVVLDQRIPDVRSRYSITPHGQGLIKSIEDLRSLPPIDLGGCRAYR